jgi:hypothetical protein
MYNRFRMSHHTVETIELPEALNREGYGKWSPIVKELEKLEPGKVKRFQPRLTKSQMASLRSAAQWRRRSIHVRNTPTETHVWLGGELEGFEKYRKKSKVSQSNAGD